jgi:FAD/FMN-containing dehydrogenase
MVLPLTADDASVIIKSITETSCPFGIRSGGHGFFALSSGVDIGVTIDFSKYLCLASANITQTQKVVNYSLS